MRPLGSLAVVAAAVVLTATGAGAPSHDAHARPTCDQSSGQGGTDKSGDCCDDRYEECEPHGDVFPD